MWWIIGGIIIVVIIVYLFSFGKAAAPSIPRDQIIDDFMQSRAISGEDKNSTEQLIEYLKKDTNKTITSGCPVENNK